jgi:2-(1,2-epoxy-1,2-dihydrophenyl)acetyl-CoA isomerase
MAEKVLIIEKRGKVAIVTLNRPEQLNALNKELQDSIIQACQDLSANDSVWAVVITGAGRGFCSGLDIRGSAPSAGVQFNRKERMDDYGWTGKLAFAIYKTLEKPIIAAVNGIAAGAGMSVALACNLRVGSEKTRFKTVFIERNLSPDTGMSYFLPRIVGYSRACDLIFTSRNVEPDEAYRIGLLDRVVPADKILDEAVSLANQIANWPPMAMQAARRVLEQSMESSLDEQLRNEIFGISFARKATHDTQESQASFVEKRPPKFTGQ